MGPPVSEKKRIAWSCYECSGSKMELPKLSLPRTKNLTKNLIIRAEKTFLQNNTVWYAFYSKFANFTDFEKKVFFRKTHLFFFKKKTNFERFEKFSRILRQSCHNLVKKNLTFRNVNEHRECNWQTLDKKDVRNGPIERKICFHILKNMAQNIKLSSFWNAKKTRWHMSYSVLGSVSGCRPPSTSHCRQERFYRLKKSGFYFIEESGQP